jgi:NAD(P)-dependent dehydrogenase (short-subunit alcohol dehydrogenase family)
MSLPARQVAIVTGALGGIGRATVRRLLQDGWAVAASYAQGVETPEQAMALKAELGEDGEDGEFGDRISLHPLNLAHSASIRAFFTEVLAAWGRLDALVNNAAVGTATVADYASDSTQQDELLLHINAAGTLTLTQLFVAQMRNQWGDTALAELPAAKLVSISSVGGGMAAFPHFRLADGMSKAAVAFMTRQIAAEHVHTPLDVFAICPGATNTGMFQASTLNAMSDAERAAFVARLPKQRLIQPPEIAELIAFLLTPHSRVLHGAVLDASMGLGGRPGLMTEMGH